MAVSQRSALDVQRDVIYALLLREMGGRFGKTRVGLMWALLEPLAHMAFPIVFFGIVLGRSMVGYEYPVVLAYGLLPFVLFKTICIQTMEGGAGGRNLLSYRQVHLLDIFVARALSVFVIEALIFTLLFAALGMLGFDVLPARPLELLATMAATVLLAFGLGLTLAALSSFVPDARAIVKVLFLPLYFASGVLFPVSRLPGEWIDWLAFNPVVHLVEMSRYSALQHYRLIDQINMVYPVALMIFVLFTGLALYRLRAISKVTA